LHPDEGVEHYGKESKSGSTITLFKSDRWIFFMKVFGPVEWLLLELAIIAGIYTRTDFLLIAVPFLSGSNE